MSLFEYLSDLWYGGPPAAVQNAPQETRATETLFNYDAYTQSMNTSYLATATKNEALSVSAFDRGVQLIAEVISDFPVHLYEGDEQLPTPPLLESPFPRETRKDTIYGWVVDYLLYGNSFGLLSDMDSLMRPGSIVPVMPKDVVVRHLQTGGLEYSVRGERYEPWQLMHIKGFHNSGDVIGVGALERAHHTIGHAHTQNDHSYKVLKEGSVPPAVIESPLPMEAQEKRDLQDAWVRRQGNSKIPGVLDGGMELKEYGFNNHQQQLLEARHFSVKEIAGHLNIDSYWLGNDSGNSNTYSNVEAKALHLINFTLRGILTRFEQAFSRLVPEGQYVRFEYDALLRADTLNRYQAHAIALAAGFMTPNEVRKLEGLPPIPDGDEVQKASEPATLKSVNPNSGDE